MSLEAYIAWIGDTPWSTALHESQYAYTFIEAAHVLGITLFAGTIAMVDLRLLGLAFREVKVSEMNGRVLPWTIAGFVLMVATGLLLFYAIPVRTYHSVWFRTKMLLMLIAGANIVIYTFVTERGRASWDTAPRPPAAAQTAALVSLLIWTGVIVTGRMIAYNWFDCDRPQPSLINAIEGCPPGGMTFE
jgi:hypothetical protein